MSEQGDDTLSMSFLDVISCALGAAVILGLVFSIVRREASVTTSSPEFIRLTLHTASSEPDVHPLLNVIVKPPGHAEGFDLVLEDFDLVRGRPRPRAERRDRGLPIDNLRLFGFSRHGEHRKFLAGDGQEVLDANASDLAVYRLMVKVPEPGEWQFDVRFAGLKGAEDAEDLSDAQLFTTIRVRASVATRDSQGTRQSETHLGFGQRSQELLKVSVAATGD